MDTVDDVTDDLMGLPGFVRRNLLLMRELDVKFDSLLNDAKQKEHGVLTTLFEQPAASALAEERAEPREEGSPAPLKRQGSEGERGAAKGRGSKQKQTSDAKAKSPGGDAKRQCRGNAAQSPNEPGAAAEPESSPASIDPEVQQEIEAIQQLRMDAMYLMQEKLAVNDQVTCMLKHEYEYLKVVFDNMYREMETSGQMTEKLRASFTVNKAKSQAPIESVLSSTEQDILGVGPAAPAAEAEAEAAAAPATAATATRSGSLRSLSPLSLASESASNASSAVKQESGDSAERLTKG
ncbi:CXXC1, SPP1, CPS40 [Babesia caballi]|uniref:CXXC1, SPP1, CPS40 n=1 Tax=Babesia caballi TaxID=5871 RepID=A0AAV4M2K5_BABCB|nr:CXXC1, SPP1, CPS40 [Babesia caballi]